MSDSDEASAEFWEQYRENEAAAHEELIAMGTTKMFRRNHAHTHFTKEHLKNVFDVKFRCQN